MIKIKCGQCGKPIHRKPIHLKTYKHHFCSIFCFNIWQKGRKQSPKSIKKRIDKIRGRKTGKFFKCAWCGKRIYKYPRDLKYKHHFCSKKCACIFRRGKRVSRKTEFKSGENSPNWKGGISKTRLKSGYYKRDTAKLLKWKKRVYRRDKWNCQLCGKHGGKIVAHHIFFYEQFPLLRLKIKNGITLCQSCHISLHKSIGVKDLLKAYNWQFQFVVPHSKYRDFLFQLLWHTDKK